MTIGPTRWTMFRRVKCIITYLKAVKSVTCIGYTLCVNCSFQFGKMLYCLQCFYEDFFMKFNMYLRIMK